MINHRYFHLVKCTAMGTLIVDSYAMLTLGYLKKILYYKINERVGEEYDDFINMNWKRYLDECFMINIFWTKKESNLNIVCNIFNALDPDIKCLPKYKNIPFYKLILYGYIL